MNTVLKEVRKRRAKLIINKITYSTLVAKVVRNAELIDLLKNAEVAKLIGNYGASGKSLSR
ncbi:hypothetical protein [Lysinibacillus sp. Bpr_S20]|uniref:hypothetical protein n=1 Tax=Lysinibacillus sp. Bpr_S20 TaxID=2933964 RepID=UPI002011C3AB|nr:hypothetical protein [Lysinibacillus sp. Bpr_S20]MCL1701600.1 hypothetical protein [Lysinibacillus sp. Bpr_S20]